MEKELDAVRAHARELADSFLEKGDKYGWFEALYAEAGGDNGHIPWADLEPNPFLVKWAGSTRLLGTRERALVVGCGLGDEAGYLHERGYDVTGFDVSPTAIEWAKRLHAGSGIEFREADLFHAPAEWAGAFDLVVEVYTVQALPLEMRESAIEAIADFVVSGGRLVVVNRGRNDDEEPDGPPWAISRSEMRLFERRGLKLMDLSVYFGEEEEPEKRFVAEFLREE